MLSRARVLKAVQTLAAPSGTVRFGAGKALCATAARHPARVYPYFDTLAGLLCSDSKVIRWNALQLIGSLAPADTDRRVDAHLGTILAFIAGDNLITAANAIRTAGQIARARPDLLDRILPALLGVEHASYATPECRNVAIGHTLDVLAELGHDACGRPEVAAFVQRQRGNPRPAVARRAAQLAAAPADTQRRT